MLFQSQKGPYYLDMKDYLHSELKKKLVKYKVHKNDLLYIDPYYLNKYLNSTEHIKDIMPFLRHLLQYTYRASITEVINEHELNEINSNLERIERLIKKLLKAQGLDDSSPNPPPHSPKNEEVISNQ